MSSDEPAKRLAIAINNLARAMVYGNQIVSHIECLACGLMDFDFGEDAVSLCKCSIESDEEATNEKV